MRVQSFVAGLSILAVQTISKTTEFFNEFTKLTEYNFRDAVLEDPDNMWFVTFYTDWCPYCKTLDQELFEARDDETIQDKKVKFGVVELMSNKNLMRKYDIKSAPIIKVFGEDKFNPEDYSGRR